MLTAHKSRRLLAVLASIVAPVAAHAQSQVFGQDVGQELREITPTAPVVVTDVSVSAEYHSNVFRLADGVNPTALFGKSQRSDTIWRAGLGVRFDREISLQRFRLDARIEPTKYQTYTQFDHLAYNAGGQWDWSIGRPLFGTLGIRATRNLTSFVNNVLGGSKNLQSREVFFGTAGYRLTPSLAIIVGADVANLDNSASQFQSANYRFTSGEAGVRYAPGTGTEAEVVLRNTRGKYDQLQTFDAAGNVLPTGINNDFKQNALLGRVQYRPSEDTRLAGQVGYVQRSYDAVGARDFSGPTIGMNFDWRPSGAFYMRTTLFRDITSQELLTSNYVDVTTLRLEPSVVLTGKIIVTGLVSYSNWQFKGDPTSLTGTPQRKDDLTTLGAGLTYDYSRLLALTANVATERRTSNIPGIDFTNNTFLVGARFRF